VIVLVVVLVPFLVGVIMWVLITQHRDGPPTG
jgi:hypothetical protein